MILIVFRYDFKIRRLSSLDAFQKFHITTKLNNRTWLGVCCNLYIYWNVQKRTKFGFAFCFEN